MEQTNTEKLENSLDKMTDERISKQIPQHKAKDTETEEDLGKMEKWKIGVCEVGSRLTGYTVK